jgi:hypothetical protein
MMQSCASAAKLRGGGPILNRGSKAMSNIGLPSPRLVICGLVSTGEQTAESQSCLATGRQVIVPSAEGVDRPAPRRWSPAAKVQ